MSLYTMRRGFTLIELLVVMTIIAALIALSVPAIASARDRAAQRSTQSLINSLTAAMLSYGTDVVDDPSTQAVRLLWYFPGDGGFLDGDPQVDPGFNAALRAAASDTGYRGPLHMLPVAVPERHIDDQTGRAVDSWGNPLYVFDPAFNDPSNPYHARQDLMEVASGIALWSAGPDSDPSTTDDNLTSWSER